jgi:hypothetical protein
MMGPPFLGRVAHPCAGSVGDPQSLNRYAYVGNNPMNRIDPSGLCAESFWGETCADFDIVIFWSWGSGRDGAGGRVAAPL